MKDHIYDGQTLKAAFKSAEKLLEQRIDELNTLNVYPVPDGDTGINMFLTMQAATASLEKLETNSVAVIAPQFARGALLGARGNSGVILSQIFRGMANVLETKTFFTSADFALALRHGSEKAYHSVAQPVEGTILTVIREAADAAGKIVTANCDLRRTITAVTNQARSTVKRTPELLPILREAGVVDAGGKGLAYVFQGMRQSILAEMHRYKATNRPKPVILAEDPGSGYGFDLQFLIHGMNLNIDELRQNISPLGESVLIVGDKYVIRVHIHTKEPQSVIDYCMNKGELTDIIKEDMDQQAASFKASGKSS